MTPIPVLSKHLLAVSVGMCKIEWRDWTDFFWLFLNVSVDICWEGVLHCSCPRWIFSVTKKALPFLGSVNLNVSHAFKQKSEESNTLCISSSSLINMCIGGSCLCLLRWLLHFYNIYHVLLQNFPTCAMLFFSLFINRRTIIRWPLPRVKVEAATFKEKYAMFCWLYAFLNLSHRAKKKVLHREENIKK